MASVETRDVLEAIVGRLAALLPGNPLVVHAVAAPAMGDAVESAMAAAAGIKFQRVRRGEALIADIAPVAVFEE